VSGKRRQLANQANAKVSTGPRTAAGKRTVAQNAFRHGLNLPALCDEALVPEIEALAQRIVGGSIDPLFLGLARQIAAAQIELNRVRSNKLRLIAVANAQVTGEPLGDIREGNKPTRKLRAAFVAAVVERSSSSIGHDVPPRCEGLSLTLDDLCLEVELLDRYERRAISRRKFAIRNFDALKSSKESRAPAPPRYAAR
jgi:hypothetical protein